MLNRADDSGLSRWELCGPDLARLITEFQDQVDRNNTNLNIRHHEDNLQFQKTFFEDVNKTIAGMHCNPFEMQTLTAINNPSISFAQNVFSDISKVELRGKEQLLDFVKHRLLEPSVSIDTKITKNQLALPGHKEKAWKSSAPTTNLNNSLMTKLRSCISYRRNEVIKVFDSEILGVSQCLSLNNEELYHGSKSDLLKRFDSSPKPCISTSDSSIIIELSVSIKSNARISVATFKSMLLLC